MPPSTFTGNNFSNSYIGERVRREDAATGVLLENTADIAISGNIFTGLTGPAVEVEGKCRRLVLAGNVAADLKKENNRKGEIAALALGTTDDAVLGANAFEGR